MKQFTCPECGSHYFGTSNCTGPQDTWIRHCHGYYDDARRCDFSFAVADDHKYFADEQNGSKEIDMELRKEYEAIAQQFASSIYDCTGLGEAHDIVRNAVTACQELADRPPRELTDDEIVSAINNNQGAISTVSDARAIIAAHIAKQREPQVVKFRAARFKTGQRIEMFSDLPNEHWEWLEPAQEFEVRI